jgi:hypothetical protein
LGADAADAVPGRISYVLAAGYDAAFISVGVIAAAGWTLCLVAMPNAAADSREAYFGGLPGTGVTRR